MYTVLLQVSLLDFDNREYVANYGSFSVGSEATNYVLSLSGYDEKTSTLADGLAAGHNTGAPFTTIDRDNDYRATNSCASQFSGGTM